MLQIPGIKQPKPKEGSFWQYTKPNEGYVTDKYSGEYVGRIRRGSSSKCMWEIWDKSQQESTTRKTLPKVIKTGRSNGVRSAVFAIRNYIEHNAVAETVDKPKSVA